MAIREILLTGVQWAKIQPLLPQRLRSARGGRPAVDDRRCFEGILWVLRTGARWKDLSSEFPSPSTCWRRMKEWAESGVLEAIWTAFLDEFNDQQLLDWDEVFVDASFSPAKKGGFASKKPSAGKEPSGCFWLMARVFPWHAGPRVGFRTNTGLHRSRWPKTSRHK